ncbi:MAG TPA: LysR family transcriptional regulator [Acidimicrobiales bacterium]|nr:LysR family transcriptional regulator [Acidimicrobiales bacterium]
MIDVRRLIVLKAVVENGSLAAAAAALSYTPSAVSQHVTSLEKETGTQLLERVGRGVRPTDAGYLLSQHASHVLGSIHEAEEALAALRSGHIGRIRVGAFPTAGSSVVPVALAAFRRRFPKVALGVTVAEPDEAIANLRAGAIDIAVVVEGFAPGHAPRDGLRRRHLLSDPFRVLLPRGHRLANRRAVALANLAGEPWIGVRSCPPHCRDVVEDACQRAGFESHHALEADEYPTAQGFVAAGLGVALVPLLALGAAVHPGVVARRVKGEQPVREVWAATRPVIADHLTVKAMLDDLEEAAHQFAAAQS